VRCDAKRRSTRQRPRRIARRRRSGHRTVRDRRAVKTITNRFTPPHSHWPHSARAAKKKKKKKKVRKDRHRRFARDADPSFGRRDGPSANLTRLCLPLGRSLPLFARADRGTRAQHTPRRLTRGGRCLWFSAVPRPASSPHSSSHHVRTPSSARRVFFPLVRAPAPATG
jgi:hypothetical protein